MRDLFISSIHEIKEDPGKYSRMRAYMTQYTPPMKGAVDIWRLTVGTCGGRSILKSFPLELGYRDAHCGSQMFSWTTEACLYHQGRETLHEKVESDLEHNWKYFTT